MQSIERVILIALMRDMREKGYEVASVWDGENYWMRDEKHYMSCFADDAAPDEILSPMTDEDALKEIDAVDSSTLHFTHRNKRSWGSRAVRVILGNGEDVLSDFYDAKNEPFGAVVRRIYDRLNKGLVP